MSDVLFTALFGFGMWAIGRMTGANVTARHLAGVVRPHIDSLPYTLRSDIMLLLTHPLRDPKEGP